MIIGIDLGTTFSVIAVKGKVRTVDGYKPAVYLDRYDVSIIPDEYANTLIPSVVWEDPGRPGVTIVGDDAKRAADDGYNPIMFAKRHIGTNITHPLGNKALTGREVAREVLTYSKNTAETALGVRIDQAVVTLPAYFDLAMREETLSAAQEAGFRITEDHLLTEPIAAAMAYLWENEADPLRILTYDLGGGTFDVTAIERRGGATAVKSIGGNRLLGGFNFDRRLASWIFDG